MAAGLPGGDTRRRMRAADTDNAQRSIVSERVSWFLPSIHLKERKLVNERRVKTRRAILPLVAAVTGLSALASSQVHASPITVTSVAVPYNETVTITEPGLDVTAYTGQIELTTSAGLLDVWCIDVYHDIGVGNVGDLPYQFGTISTNFDGSSLTTSQIAQIAGLIATGNSLMKSSPSNVLSAGIQMAIWSVEFPSLLSFSDVPADTISLDLPQLGFTGAMNALEIADQLVADAPNLRGNGETVQSLVGTQSFATTVPEPATLTLLGAGFVALAGIRRTRRS